MAELSEEMMNFIKVFSQYDEEGTGIIPRDKLEDVCKQTNVIYKNIKDNYKNDTV